MTVEENLSLTPRVCIGVFCLWVSAIGYLGVIGFYADRVVIAFLLAVALTVQLARVVARMAS